MKKQRKDLKWLLQQLEERTATYETMVKRHIDMGNAESAYTIELEEISDLKSLVEQVKSLFPKI